VFVSARAAKAHKSWMSVGMYMDVCVCVCVCVCVFVSAWLRIFYEQVKQQQRVGNIGESVCLSVCVCGCVFD